jgi:GNAT superfamily N-acetyltransferase
MEIQEYHRENYTISTDPARLNIETIHEFLHQHTYWASTRPLDVVRRSVENSLNFGVYCGKTMVGYARVVTDYATFSWLCDVVILPDHRGKGLGKWLVQCVVNHPDLINQRRIMLATRDANELYRVYGGFKPLDHPSRWMEKIIPIPNE